MRRGCLELRRRSLEIGSREATLSTHKLRLPSHELLLRSTELGLSSHRWETLICELGLLLLLVLVSDTREVILVLSEAGARAREHVVEVGHILA